MNHAEKPLRADAERNRQAIVCAAGRVFAERGTTVTLEAIAEAAGVGVGTIYRRFPTIEDLVAVVLEEKMSRYADRTEAAAEHARTEPSEAFREWVLCILEQQAIDLAFSEVILTAASTTELFRTELFRALRASIELVKLAQAQGAVRQDFHHSDLLMMQHANAGLVKGSQQAAPQASRRLGEYLLQAFTVDAGTLPPPPPVWVDAEHAENCSRYPADRACNEPDPAAANA